MIIRIPLRRAPSPPARQRPLAPAIAPTCCLSPLSVGYPPASSARRDRRICRCRPGSRLPRTETARPSTPGTLREYSGSAGRGCPGTGGCPYQCLSEMISLGDGPGGKRGYNSSRTCLCITGRWWRKPATSPPDRWGRLSARPARAGWRAPGRPG